MIIRRRTMSAVAQAAVTLCAVTLCAVTLCVAALLVAAGCGTDLQPPTVSSHHTGRVGSRTIAEMMADAAMQIPPGMSGGAADNMLSPGDPVPALSLWDESGEEFATTSLRGQYSVLIFGCLT